MFVAWIYVSSAVNVAKSVGCDQCAGEESSLGVPAKVARNGLEYQSVDANSSLDANSSDMATAMAKAMALANANANHTMALAMETHHPEGANAENPMFKMFDGLFKSDSTLWHRVEDEFKGCAGITLLKKAERGTFGGDVYVSSLERPLGDIITVFERVRVDLSKSTKIVKEINIQVACKESEYVLPIEEVVVQFPGSCPNPPPNHRWERNEYYQGYGYIQSDRAWNLGATAEVDGCGAATPCLNIRLPYWTKQREMFVELEELKQEREALGNKYGVKSEELEEDPDDIMALEVNFPQSSQMWDVLDKEEEVQDRYDTLFDKYCHQIAQAVLEIHELGYAHHDLDLSNIMVTGKGDIRIFNFGCAASVSERVICGSPLTLPPSVACGRRPIGKEHDWFAFAHAIFIMHTHEFAFESEVKGKFKCRTKKRKIGKDPKTANDGMIEYYFEEHVAAWEKFRLAADASLVALVSDIFSSFHDESISTDIGALVRQSDWFKSFDPMDLSSW